MALSFPGEKRAFIRQVADLLAKEIGQEQVLYDDYLTAELTRPNLDEYLGKLYHEDSELLVPFFCADYEKKEWCGIEWRQMRDILKRKQDDRILPFRFDDAPIAGVLSIDGYVKIGNRPPSEMAKLILKRIGESNDAKSVRSVQTAPLPALLHQLPSLPAKFIGRDEVLDDLVKILTVDNAAGVTISSARAGLQGMGGVGKTALAVVLAHRLKSRYSAAQLYLNLRGADTDHRQPVSPADAMQTIIHSFHPEMKLPEAIDQLAPIYNSVLTQAGAVLLFLDNTANADQIRPLLPPENCLLLVTSRTQFSLPGLESRQIDCLPPEKSQELLRTLAPRITGYEPEAAELCGHLPLALEVVAGIVNDKKVYDVSELLHRIRVNQEKLNRLDAAFQASYDLLNESLRRQWILLSVFPAPFDLRAAAAVWNNVAIQPDASALETARESLQILTNSNLVEYNQANARFRLHDVARRFCDGELTKFSEAARTALRFRYAEHYAVVGNEMKIFT